MRPPIPSHLRSLASKTDDWYRRANASLLSQLPCRAGCFHCCTGIFPITRLDLPLLQEGLAQLPADQREGIEARAMRQVNALEAAYPRLRMRPSLDGWADDQIDEAVQSFHESPCPALQADGLCAVYAYRPLTCRSMGIPTRQDGIVNGACSIQTFVPVTQLSASLEMEEQELAASEAAALEQLPEVDMEGEEIFLPYAFVPVSLDSSRLKRPKAATTCQHL
ncbi:MAG TPA: YkgJ family cysteine cluster protein [Nitrospira sp.]|jgi:Fe-S-cluster containining protein|nr:YkgJ family cysteine cluster protein [Nitrospira sp.]